MTEYSSLNVKLPNSQLNKSKSGIRNVAELTLNLSSNVIGDSNDETNFPHNFGKNSWPNIKLLKTQLSKIVQSAGFLVRLLGPVLKAGLPLIKNVLKPLATSVLIPLR